MSSQGSHRGGDGSGPALRVARAAEAHAGAERVASYDLFKRLSLAPPFELHAALDTAGRPHLLELVRCRRPRSPREVESSRAFVRQVARATETLRAEEGVPLVEHGAFEFADGRLALFWATPWTPELHRLGRATEWVDAPEHVARVGLDLLARLAERHRRGRVDPQLQLGRLLVRENGQALVVGAPLPLSPEELEAPASEQPPEESLTLTPGPAGDMWRLGRVLAGLAARVEAPRPLATIIEALLEPNPTIRLVDVEQAAEQLGVLRRALRLPRPVQRASEETPPPSAEPPPAAREPATLVVELPDEHGPQGTVVGVRALGVAADEAETRELAPMSPVRALAVRSAAPERSDRTPPLRVEPESKRARSAPEAPAELRAPAALHTPLATPPAAELGLLARLKRRAVLLALIGALGFFGLALFATSLEHRDPQRERRRHVSQANEVLLTTVPSDSVVVSEADGKLLGAPPLRFLVPAGSKPSVLVAAAGFEPRQVTLPPSGAAQVELQPLASYAPCELDIALPTGGRVEPLKAEVESGARYKIHGAALFRGQNFRGAWIVRCPALGGRPSYRLSAAFVTRDVWLSFHAPAGGQISVESKGLGPIPVRRPVPPGFSLLRLDTPEGAASVWLPAFNDVDLDLSGLELTRTSTSG